MKTLVLSSILMILLFAPVLSIDASHTGDPRDHDPSAPSSVPTVPVSTPPDDPDDDPIVPVSPPPPSPGGGVGSLVSPLKFNSLVEFFNAVLDVIIIIAVPVIVFFIIWAGFMYVTAGGDTSKIQKATTAFTWVVVGGLLILGAKVLVEIIEGTIDSFT